MRLALWRWFAAPWHAFAALWVIAEAINIALVWRFNTWWVVFASLALGAVAAVLAIWLEDVARRRLYRAWLSAMLAAWQDRADAHRGERRG